MKMIALRFTALWFCLAAATLFTADLKAQTMTGYLREAYIGIGGSAVSDLTGAAAFPASPTIEELLTNSFEGPISWSVDYGTRIRALLVPPVTGSYVFWIASDDGSQLYLSTDESPANKRLIASVSSWTGSRQYLSYSEQQSAPIALTNGQRYYVEALHKQGGGGDNLAVAWQKPGDPAVVNDGAPIPAIYAIPFGVGPPQITAQPANLTVVENGSASFTFQLARYLGMSYQWQRNGTNIVGMTSATLTLAPVRLADSGSLYRCFVTNILGGTNTINALLTVTPDITRPAISSVSALGDPNTLSILYSEPVDPVSAANAANYAINNGVQVLAAAVGMDDRSIVLTTTAMPIKTVLTLTVNNVRDRAVTPNTIATNSVRTFSIAISSPDVASLIPPLETIGPSSRRSPLVISEVMYHPAPRTNAQNIEYVEIYNSQPWFEEIGGFRIAGAVDFTFPSNTVIQGRSYMVVAANPADIKAVYGIANVTGPFIGSNGLANGSGTLRLFNDQGALLLEMAYRGEPLLEAKTDGTGHSMVLARPSYGEGDPRAWLPSDIIGGSPGKTETAGSNPFRPIMINEIKVHPSRPDTQTGAPPGFIELYSHTSANINLSGCILTDDPRTNKFVIPTNSIILGTGFLMFNETRLGFEINAAGGTIYFKNPTGTRVLDAFPYGPQEVGVSEGRFPDGAPEWSRMSALTPGTNNAKILVSDVVINEIMYKPITGDNDDQYVELHNRGTNLVNLNKWRLSGGISFTFPQNVEMLPDSYIVIARNAARIATNYPSLPIANLYGDFKGSLAGSGERLVLEKTDQMVALNASSLLVTNTVYVAIDEVTYAWGGQWGSWAAGGGSSLERIDARADARQAANWADSDETAKSGWITIENTGVLDNGNSDANSFHILVMDGGECLIDNVEVIPQGGGNLVANSTFDQDASGWFFQGTHSYTHYDASGGVSGGGCLHVQTTGRGDTGGNRIYTTLTRVPGSGETVTLRARVRWLKGSPLILLRLHGNWLDAEGFMPTAHNFGTPGARNSRAAANIGPCISQVTHSPALPQASQGAIVTAHVYDPDGLSSLVVRYRLDPSTNYTTLNMVNRGGGLYSASVPAQTNGALVAYYIQATDHFSGAGVFSTYPSDTPARECLIRWGEPTQSGSLGVYRFWFTQKTMNRWMTREQLSNDPLDGTFVYGNTRVIYNTGGLYSGSPWHSPGYNSPLGNNCDYVMVFPGDNSILGETEISLLQPGNGGGDPTLQNEQHAYWLARELDLPWCYRRHIHLFLNGTRRGALYEDAQQPGGDLIKQWYPSDSKGNLHKIQIWYEFDAPLKSFSAWGSTLSQFTTTGGVKKKGPYRWMWSRRAAGLDAFNYTNLYTLVDSVNTSATGDAYTRTVQNVVNVDEWLRIDAIEHIVGNSDSYAYGGGQNMYAYKPVNSGWNLLIWDIDFAFFANGATSDLFGIGGANCGPRNDHPPFARMYWQALIDAANGPLTAARSNPQLDARYNAMVADGIAASNPQGIKDFISQRRDYILGLVASNSAPMAIASNSGADFATNRNIITLTGTAPLGVRYINVNGLLCEPTWTTINNWVIQIPLGAGANRLSVQGYDAHGTAVTGASNTINIQLTAPLDPPEQKLVINEIMYHPAVTNAEYIELYNSSTNTVYNLSNWRLEGVDFTFPAGTLMEPGAFLMVAKNAAIFASTYGSNLRVAGEYSGTLKHSGETLRLVKPGVTPDLDFVVDSVTYGSELPWPAESDGGGASLQLIDPAQDNNRVGNWAGVSSNAVPPPPSWQYITQTGVASSSALYIYLQSAGDAYIDDIKLVAGSVAEAGPNLLPNGEFESAFPGPFTVSDNHSASALSTSVKHSGNTSLHLVASIGGTTRGSSIYQDISPALTSGANYTLSFWYRPGNGGGPLTVRFSGSWVSITVDTATTTTAVSQYTPGRANTVRAALPAFPPLWLNEVEPNNVSGPADRFSERDPWVELFNGGTNTLSLADYYLTDNCTNLTQWAFPAGTTIDPGRFLTVWLDGQPQQSSASELHASFRISPDSGSVLLTHVAASTNYIQDYLNYSGTGPDRSWGSFPDGKVAGRRVLYVVSPGGTNNAGAPPITVFINEWMANNVSSLMDLADQSYKDWFELFNPGSNAVNLADYYLTDTLTDKTQFKIPAGVSIPAQGYLLVWADSASSLNATSNADLHVNFKLKTIGEAIGLFAPDGTMVDGVTFGPQLQNIGQGRYPDGQSSIINLTNPTPRSANSLVSINPTITLGIQIVPGGQAILQWPALQSGFILETCTEIGSGLQWQAVNPPSLVSNSVWAVTNGTQSPMRFYRLRKL